MNKLQSIIGKRTLLPLAAVALIHGCDSSDSFGGSQSVAVDQANLTGTWVLDSVQGHEGLDLVASGSARRRYRANGTWFDACDALTVTVNDRPLFASCDAYAAGYWNVAPDALQHSDITLGVMKGDCGVASEPPFVTDLGSDRRSARLVDGTLRVERPVEDEEVGSVTFVYRRLADEQWRGTGWDPAFSGEWTFDDYYVDARCETGKAQSNWRQARREALHGVTEMHFEEGSWRSKAKDFAFGGHATCSGWAKGALDPTDFGPMLRLEDASAPCMRERFVDPPELEMRSVYFADTFAVLLRTGTELPSCGGTSRVAYVVVAKRR